MNAPALHLDRPVCADDRLASPDGEAELIERAKSDPEAFGQLFRTRSNVRERNGKREVSDRLTFLNGRVSQLASGSTAVICSATLPIVPKVRVHSNRDGSKVTRAQVQAARSMPQRALLGEPAVAAYLDRDHLSVPTSVVLVTGDVRLP